MNAGAWSRFSAVFVKEFLQLKRDRLTFATMIFIPVVQLLLFGYAINNDPKHLPTTLLVQDDSSFARALQSALTMTDHFRIEHVARSEAEADADILSGRSQFIIQIPANFGRDLVHGAKPSVVVVVDATDPTATNAATLAINGAAQVAFDNDLKGPLANLRGRPGPYELRIQKRYNPTGDTQLNIVPGLVGTILTLTMLIFTALSVTREIERGTMESLLAMPVRPVEIMLGKIAPYALVGAAQLAIILAAAVGLFGVPIVGSLTLFCTLTMLFIVANLSVGYTFSTVATNQLQAMQMSFFFFLPSLLLSGFLFPFRGMPVWAQTLGEILPLTHFVRIARAIMLKGSGAGDLVFDTTALGLFTLVAMGVAVARFRQTLD